ncbi:Conserved_hypothetical protein [Hexamita inflata]|uniref:Leucine rich repeat protein n=1 Tax=Hexamita inflata TaxID=28002 RepID=A0AA86QE04_9EUKA|nr:Conserved hypothetical protein [Hexamita inflata]
MSPITAIGIFRMFQTPSLQQLQEREYEIKNEYTVLNAETILKDLAKEIMQEDNKILTQLQNKIQQNLNQVTVQNIDIYSLKFIEQLIKIDENTQVTLNNCEFCFDEVSKQICNLTIENSAIDSFDGIQHMKQLKQLTITEQENTITTADLHYLSQLENVQIVDLSENEIRDLDINFQTLKKLISLDLSGNEVRGVLCLPQTLKFLNLSDAYFYNVEQLLALPNLINLNLSSNQVEDVQVIKQLKALTSLYLANNLIQDLSPLYDNDKLIELDVSNNKINSLNSCNGKFIFQNLQELLLNNNLITNISDLQFMPSLEYVDLSKNNITDVIPLRFTNISSLNIDGNKVNNIWPLKNLPLEELRICNNGLIDISVVKYLTKLKQIDYVYNYITNIDALSNRHIKEITTKKSKYFCNNPCIGLDNSFEDLSLDPSLEELEFFSQRVYQLFSSNNQIREINNKRNSKQIIFNRQKNVVAEKLKETVQKQIFFTSNVLNLFRKMQ